MRSPVLSLTWRLARSSGRRGLQSQLLAAGAAAVGSFVLLVMVAAALGAGARADHTTWRTPVAASAQRATAVQVTTVTYARGEPVTVVNLAQLAGRHPTPAPPGLTAFPRPGQVYVSPALAVMLHDLPGGRLADRFPEAGSYGTVDPAGLASPDELVAVVGRAPSDPAVAVTAGAQNYYDDGLTERALVSGFDGARASLFTGSDRGAVLLGVVLLIMPVVVLAAAAGRLGAARREQRLAALRLAGATPWQILAMTAVEAAAVGAAGALTGALAHIALLPALAELPYGVGGWYTGQLWVGLPWLAAVVAAVTVLITLSAVTMLRQVATSPLGVAQQANPRRTRAIRLVFFVAVLAYIWTTTADGGQLKTRQLIALLVLFYGAFWLFGPWVVDRLGRIAGRWAERPATLLAARRLSDDPRGAWRTVSGLVLAGFVAGFFSISALGLDGANHEGQVGVITANAADARHAAVEARTLLKRAGVTATVTVTDEDDYDGLLGGVDGVIARVSGSRESVDTAVTALTPLGSGRYPITQEYVSAPDDVISARVATASTATLVLGFLVAAASAGLTAAANVLDRRRVYGLLRLAGTPLKVLDRARIHETVIPLVVLAGGTTAMGAFGAAQVNKLAGTTMNTAGAVQLVICLAVGALAVLAAIAGSRPLLRRVTQGPAQTAD
ncbi:FtsX-like permease family protein [Streptomyces sp. NPDC020597]|uniref:FtsX-like permease family protein n=1 Tax=unclassified Streptomyces TaxID=2593676 RepID=UPI0037BA7214